MFFKYIALIFTIISVTMGKPQLLTFKDGNVGVNFLGFNAQAGLGGFLTGNAAHGGLSASAGTPFGQRAAAGIGGRNGDDGTYGGAFAGATAGNGVSAGAGLAGTAGGIGILGAEASAGGVTKNAIKTVGVIEGGSSVYAESPAVVAVAEQPGATVIQKIKPPKKYAGEQIIEDEPNNGEFTIDIDARLTANTNTLPLKVETNANYNDGFVVKTKTIGKAITTAIEEPQPIEKDQQSADILLPPSKVLTYRKNLRPLRRRLHLQKQFTPFVYQYQQPSVVEVAKRHQVAVAPVEYSKVKTSVLAVPAQGPDVSATEQHTITAQKQYNTNGFFDGIFNIPISTLRAVNSFLNQGFGQANVGVKKTVSVQSSY